MRHPWLAVLLSRMFPGIGQIYAGARARGIFFIIANIFLFLICVLSFRGFLLTEDAASARQMLEASLAAFLVMVVLSIYALFDAYKIAQRYNVGNAQPTGAPGTRKPWLAAFLSSIVPGFGQFYNRQFLKGTGFIVAIIVVALLEDAFMPLFLLELPVCLLAIKDAFDSAEAGNGSDGRFFRQERAVAVFIALMLSLEAVPIPEMIKEHVIEAFKVPSGSMYPTLRIGDHFLIGKTESFRDSLKRGDVIIFPYPKNPEKLFVKRVIGLGGDKIQIVNGELYINEQPVQSKRIGVAADGDIPDVKLLGPPTLYEERIGDASYQVQYFRDRAATNEGPWLVPQDAVFVLGDNRDNSQDSRFWGPVPLSTIKGKAMKIYWSWDRVDVKVRWERIGETVR